jgi:glycosyltransferase involved in cell wall biosynthesis
MGKVLLIHNGTEIPKYYSPNRRRNTFVIGSAGRFFIIKDYPLLVEIAREVLQQTDNVRFELAGEGPEKENIVRMIRKYKIESAFILKGFIDNMENFYQGLDLYINTSLHEGLPMSILEAMSHGLPVIAPKSGGLPEILKDGLEGYLVDGRNPKMFAEKCLQLYRDKELTRNMGTASRERIFNNFSIEIMAGKYYHLYYNIIYNKLT